MFDFHLRKVKDQVFDPVVPLIPRRVTPGHITTLGFLLGLSACAVAAGSQRPGLATLLWLANRLFDCLDGAVARQRGLASDLGGFYDLLSDFVVYSLIPVAVGLGETGTGRRDDSALSRWLSIALVEASFHINNFILFYCAAIGAKRSDGELTSTVMKPALIEGFESGLIFTTMLYWPQHVGSLCWLMAGLVCVGIVQRSWWVAKVLSCATGDSIERVKDK